MMFDVRALRARVNFGFVIIRVRIMRQSLASVGAILLLSILHVSAAAADRIEGFTEPYQEIELAVGEPGVLNEIHVREGSQVRQGQVLGQLDTSVLESSLEIAKRRSESVGALRAAQAELELKAKHYSQLTKLKERGHATLHETDRASTDVRVAEARLAMAEDEVALQRLECRRIEAQIQRRVIRSPIDGIVSKVWRDVGESLSGGDTHVMTLVQLHRLRAKFSLEPSLALSFKRGQSVKIAIDEPAANVKGRVETVSPVMDAKSATIEMTVDIDNHAGSLPSGARCWLVIPASANAADTTRMTSAVESDDG